jgi:hypothetical protein
MHVLRLPGYTSRVAPFIWCTAVYGYMLPSRAPINSHVLFPFVGLRFAGDHENNDFNKIFVFFPWLELLNVLEFSCLSDNEFMFGEGYLLS